MKRLTIIIVTALLIILSSCSNVTDNRVNFDIVGSNVTLWEDPTGAKKIVLAFEVSNSSNSSLYFKPSKFDIVDEEERLIDTMETVEAYPAIVQHNESGVYYGSKVSDKVKDPTAHLRAIPHIEVEKARLSRTQMNQFVTEGLKVNGELIVVNCSSKMKGENIHVAIIGRTTEGDVVSVKTDVIDEIGPLERVEVRPKDILPKQSVEAAFVTTQELHAYILPEE